MQCLCEWVVDMSVRVRLVYEELSLTACILQDVGFKVAAFAYGVPFLDVMRHSDNALV